MGGREELQIPFFSLFLAVIAAILLRGWEWLIGKTNPTLSRPSLVHDYFNCPRYLEERERQPSIFLSLLIAIFSNIHIFRREDNLGIIFFIKNKFSYTVCSNNGFLFPRSSQILLTFQPTHPSASEEGQFPTQILIKKWRKHHYLF